MSEFIARSDACGVYEEPNYAETYDSYFLTSEINKGHYKFEADLISSILNGGRVKSWGDIACGTGKHLREIQGPNEVQRFGIDRSQSMLNVARQRGGYDVAFAERDILDPSLPDFSFDLVTHLWYGYVHQPTLNDVLNFIQKSVNLTAPNGQFLLGVCDPLDVFETLEHENKLVYGGLFKIDAVTWSYTEPWSGHTYENCIAPHTMKIINLVAAQFEQCEIVTYPALDVEGHWNRKALLCRGKK